MGEIKNFKVGDLVYSGKHGSGVIKELYLATVEDPLHFAREKRASVLFTNEGEVMDVKVEEIEKMQ